MRIPHGTEIDGTPGRRQGPHGRTSGAPRRCDRCPTTSRSAWSTTATSSAPPRGRLVFVQAPWLVRLPRARHRSTARTSRHSRGRRERTWSYLGSQRWSRLMPPARSTCQRMISPQVGRRTAAAERPDLDAGRLGPQELVVRRRARRRPCHWDEPVAQPEQPARRRGRRRRCPRSPGSYAVKRQDVAAADQLAAASTPLSWRVTTCSPVGGHDLDAVVADAALVGAAVLPHHDAVAASRRSTAGCTARPSRGRTTSPRRSPGRARAPGRRRRWWSRSTPGRRR